jgi:hypothetical protein
MSSAPSPVESEQSERGLLVAVLLMVLSGTGAMLLLV